MTKSFENCVLRLANLNPFLFSSFCMNSDWYILIIKKIKVRPTGYSFPLIQLQCKNSFCSYKLI